MIAFYANKLEVKKAAEEMGILHILNEAIHKSFGYTTEAEINDLIHSVNDLFFYPNFLQQLDGCGFEYMELHPEYTFMEVTPEGFLEIIRTEYLAKEDKEKDMAEKVQLTVHNTCFLDTDATEEDISYLLSVCNSRCPQPHWKNADHYLMYSTEENITFFDENSGINGAHKNSPYRKDRFVVDVKTFTKLFEEYYSKNESKTESSPKPRFRRPRKPVPTRSVSYVRIIYTTQQVYTLKNVSALTVQEDAINIVRNNVITEGIEEKIMSVIDPKLVMAIIINEPKGVTTLFRNIHGTWETQVDGLTSDGCTRITKNLD